MTYKERSDFYLRELKGLKNMQQEGKVIGRPKIKVNNEEKPAETAEEDFAVHATKDGERKEVEDFVKAQTNELQKTHSLIVNPVEAKEKIKKIKESRLTFAQKLVQKMKSQDYFKSLFPQIKEQKPGFDYYAKITFWQFIICLYLINYYTDLDARGTQILENTN